MEHAIRLVLGVLALSIAACDGGSSGVTREPGVTTADGSVADAGHDSRTSSSAVSLDGLWVATDDPPTLLRYPDLHRSREMTRVRSREMTHRC